MRCVLDTNVIISALLLPHSKPRLALNRAFQQGIVLISAATLAEVYEVLDRLKFRPYVSEEDARLFVSVLVRDAEWVAADAKVTACRDKKDDKFLEVAVSGRATHIITGDSDLLDLDPFQDIRIISPQSFLALS